MRNRNPQEPKAVRLGCTLLAVFTLGLIVLVALLGAPKAHAHAAHAGTYQHAHRVAQAAGYQPAFPESPVFTLIERRWDVSVEDQAYAVFQALLWNGADRRVRMVRRALNGHGY